MSSTRWLFVVAAVLGTPLLVACGSERMLEPYDQNDNYAFYPDDIEWVGDKVITRAALSGDLANVQGFDGTARVRAEHHESGYTTVELALPVGDSAVMHRLDIEGGIFHEDIRPGARFTFRSDEMPDSSGLWMSPVACSGPDMDRWEIDVPVQQIDLDVSEGPTEGSLMFDWTFTKRLSYNVPEVQEQRSTGKFLLTDPGPLLDE